MSPVAPRRQRGVRTYTLALGGVLVALALAVGLFVFAIPSITSHNQTVLHLGAADFDAGSAKDRAADIARSGPILLPDPSGGTRDIFLQHQGAEVGRGWTAFDTRKAGEGRQCTLEWNAGAKHFDDPCGGAAVSATGSGLVHYRVTVTKDGRVVVDLNPNDETSGLPSGGTTLEPISTSTSTTIHVTGTVPKG